MSAWPPELFVHHPPLPWSLDASRAGTSADALDALPWSEAFAEMEALEGGAIANPDEGRQVGHYWLRAPERAPTMGQARAIGETAEAVRAFAEGVRSGAVAAEGGEPYTDVLHVGIGGSALGPQLLVDALAPAGGQPRVHFLDNTDPDGVARVIDELGPRLRQTLVVVVSKSGGTAETRSAMHMAQAAFRRTGLEVPGRMVAITGAGSRLDRQAEAEGWAARFAMWDWVGGRTSVTSAVGLLPAELSGIDTAALLRGARDMDEWSRVPTWRDNPAALLAGCWHVLGGGRGDRAMVVLPYSDRLVLLSRWLQQLVMESLGKRLDRQGAVVHQGLSVYGNKGSTDQHAYVQQLRDGRSDFFAQFVQVLGVGPEGTDDDPAVAAGDGLQGFLLGTRRALSEGGRPSLTLTVPTVDAWNLGGILALFERAVGLYATLIDVNAYHQPGVEAGKHAAAAILDTGARLRAALGTGTRGITELAEALDADPTEIHWLCERLVRTGRAVREGEGPTAQYGAT